MRKIYGELKKNDINNLESKNNQIISNESNINNNDNKEKSFKKYTLFLHDALPIDRKSVV